MIRCARLRPYNHRNGDIMRSLTMPSGLQLTAGFDLTPSPVRLVPDDKDWQILGEQPQVERFEVADLATLQARLGEELTTRMLAGGNAALAPVVDALPMIAAGPIEVIGIEPELVIVAPEPTPMPVVLAPQFTPAPPPKPQAKPQPPKRRR